MPATKKKKSKTSTTPHPRGFFLSSQVRLAAQSNTSDDLLGLKDLKTESILEVLDRAGVFKSRLAQEPHDKFEDLRGKTVINLFFEPSTRTRSSFELAAKRLSADVMTILPQASSLSKGESLKDMTENLEAMHPDILIVRHASSGVPGLIAAHTKASVINAGDGSHEHPTQGLLDLFTVRERKGSIAGQHLVIVGDIAYSRVARSNIYGFVRLGARVTCVGPATLIPPGIEAMGARVCTDLDAVLEEADVVMLLRIQKERQERLNFPSLSEYSRFYGLTRTRALRMKKEALIMHPGPINRGVEIDSEVADGLLSEGPKTVILDQVANGLVVRMAVLSLWGRQP